MVREQLDEAVFQHGHEDVHGRHQRLTFFWFLVSVSTKGGVNKHHVSVNPTCCCVIKWYQTQSEHLDLLVVFDKLVEAEQNAQPSCAVV